MDKDKQLVFLRICIRGICLAVIWTAIFTACFWLPLSATGAGPAADRVDRLQQQAQAGDPVAMYELGLAYYYGRGVLKDPAEAGCWLKRAYENGNGQAGKVYNELDLWQYQGQCDSLFSDSRPADSHRAGDIRTDTATGISFVWIPQGCFHMGCSSLDNNCSKDEKPSHRVCLDGFWMGQYEVTQGQWRRIMGTNPSFFDAGEEYPVESVSFGDVQAFLRRLNQEGSGRFFLPSEAQWEYACRGVENRGIYPFDTDTARPLANCGTCDSDGYMGQTSPAGHFPPNSLGVYDMGGNVREWCADVYDDSAYGRHALKNPVWDDSRGGARVVRGGAWTDTVDQARCAGRSSRLPGIRAHNIGFRLVLEESN